MIEPAPRATSAPALDAPRLSVLIPSWNAALTIERALASVLEERHVELECVVIDDASTDGTADVAQAVADRDPRVVVVRLPANGGVSNARNEGLAVVRGSWLAFLDADDRLLPGGIAALMRPTIDPDVLTVVGQRIWTDTERTWVSKMYDNPDVREPGRKSIATHPGLLYYASATGKAIHRSLTSDLQFEGRVLGDQPWTIRAMLRAGDGIEVIDDVVYEWSRPHSDRYHDTITAATRASAARAVPMATMARSVFLEVATEVDLRIDGAAAQLAVKQAYFDRLLRSDLRLPVKQALERRDPATGELYAAVADFLAAVPAPLLARSEVLVSAVLRPPGKEWTSLVPSGRAAYWRMVRTAYRADPRIARRIAWRRAAVPAYVLAGRLGPRAGPAAASAVLSAAAIPRRILARLRRR